MDTKEFTEQKSRISKYNSLTERIATINDVIDHQSTMRNRDSENTSLSIISYVQNSSATKEVIFNSNHIIGKAILNMLKDEVTRLEKERDKI